MDTEARKVNIPITIRLHEYATGHRILMRTPRRMRVIWNRGREEGLPLHILYVVREPLLDGLEGVYADKGDVWVLHQPDNPDAHCRVLLHEMSHSISPPITPRSSIADWAKAEWKTWQNARQLADKWGLGHLFNDALMDGYRQVIESQRLEYVLASCTAGTQRIVPARAAWDELCNIHELHGWPDEEFVRMLAPDGNHPNDQAMIELMGFDRRALRVYSILTRAIRQAALAEAANRARSLQHKFPHMPRPRPVSLVTDMDLLARGGITGTYDFGLNHVPPTGNIARILHEALTLSATSRENWKDGAIEQCGPRNRTTAYSLDISVSDGSTLASAIYAWNLALLDHPELYINPTWKIVGPREDMNSRGPVYALHVEYVDRRFVTWHVMDIRISVDLAGTARHRVQSCLQLYMSGWPGGTLVFEPAPA